MCVCVRERESSQYNKETISILPVITFPIPSEPSISPQSTAVDPSLTPVCKDEDVSLSVWVAQKGGVTPLTPTIPISEDGESSLKAIEVLAQKVPG